MDKYLTHVTDQMAGGLTAVGQQISNAITYSASQAHMAFLHLWMVLVRQQLVYGYQTLVTGILLVIASIVTARIFRKSFVSVKGKDKWDAWDRIALLLVIGIGGCYISIWLLVTGFGDIISSIPHILNPEYYALQESIQILNQIKQ